MLLFACTVASTGGFMQSWSCVRLSQFHTLLRLTTVKWRNVRAKVQAAYKSQFGCKQLHIIPVWFDYHRIKHGNVQVTFTSVRVHF